MTDLADLRAAFDNQARFCRDSGSPFSALVLERVAAGTGRAPPYGPLLESWFEATPADLLADAVPLRLLGGFHYLVLSGRARRLARLYPPHSEPDPFALGEALAEAAIAHAEVIAGFMASPPQTNEVARSLCLVGGFLTVAKATGLPLRCLELGASAGLNMNWDRYAYRFDDGAGWGDPAASVRLAGAWEGASPPRDAPVRVVERAACDQNPIDVTDADSALRLQAYVWADQTLRLERLRAAIALKRETGGVPDRADAADWTEAHATPRPGVATVIYHSVFLQYPPKAIRDRIRAAIAAAGAQATTEAPLAWLSMEPNPQEVLGPFEVKLTLWPTGQTRRLALVHPHGAKVRWLG